MFIQDWRHGSTLYGVIYEGPSQFRGGRLDAVPLPALLELEDFRRALAEAHPPPADDSYVRRIEQLLLRGTQACIEISSHHETWTDLRELPDTQRARSLAEAICRQTGLHAVAASLSKAFCSLVDRSSLVAAGTVFEVMKLALPAAYLNESQASVPDRAARELELEVTTGIAAEIILAAVDGRPVRFKPPAEPEKQPPVPVLQLPSPEKLLGVDPRGEQAAFHIAQELENRTLLQPRSAHDDLRALKFIMRLPERRPFLFPRSYLGYLDSRKDDDPAARLNAVIEIINERLADEAEHLGRFFLITDPTSRESRAFLETLRDKLSALRFVALTGDLERFVEDDRTGRALQRVYMKQAMGKETK